MSYVGDVLTIYMPGRSFPALSVTGIKCDQMCEHCRGAHLKSMINAENGPMIDMVNDLISSGGTGMLVSGGCDVKGSVPVMRAIEAIEYASKNGLSVNVHTGFLNKDDAERLAAAGAVFSADVHQDPDIIKNILNLDAAPSAYSDMLDTIISAGGRPAAHLTAGFGIADLTMSADLVKSRGLRNVILLALVPTKGTMTEDTLIPEGAVVDAVRMLKERGFDVTLGCMRPRVHRDLEIRCIEAGVRKIANPSRRTISWAEENGMEIIEERTCCCIDRQYGRSRPSSCLSGKRPHTPEPPSRL
ncbi:MAG: hypothetical protein FWD92_02135 [Methanomassiliicoccaceae archaeon]|nr:hypothetical protein [Methanomassiliicoccaceae archaeon]